MTVQIGDMDADGGDDAVATDGGQRAPEQIDSGSSSLPLKSGTVVGVVAYAATFVITYVLAEIEFEDGLASQEYETYEVVGWLAYNAHGVDVTQSGSGLSSSANFLESLYSSGSHTVPKLVFYAVPAVVLAAAGLRVARSASTGRVSAPADAAKAGATVAIGYVAAAVVGALTVFSVTVSQSAFGQTTSFTVEPELGGTVLFFAAYAVVAGAVGGYVSAQ